MDDRERFYGQFLQHATEGALQAITEAHERITGAAISHATRERLTVLLIDGLTEFQNMRPMRLSPFDEEFAERLVEALGIPDGESAALMEDETLQAVRRLIANFAESLNSYFGEIRPDSN